MSIKIKRWVCSGELNNSPCAVHGCDQWKGCNQWKGYICVANRNYKCPLGAKSAWK